MEKLSDKAKMYAKTYGQPPYGREIEGTAELLLQMSEKLAEYEDLEEQGKLLKLPCAVGDTIFAIMVDENSFEHFHCDAKISALPFDYWMLPIFGETVFLTREEAEAALKEPE